MKISPHLLSLFFLAAGASTAQAQFVGDYALTPPAANIFSANTTVGNWSYTVTNTGGNGQLTTVSAPANFTVQASGSGLGFSSSSSFVYPGVPAAGTFAFSYDFNIGVGGGGGIANVTFGHSGGSPATVVTSSSGTVSWNLSAGESISFSAFAMGGLTVGAGGLGGGAGGPGGTGLPGGAGTPTPTLSSASANISNFSFTPASVPEPSIFALGGGLVAMSAAFWYRRRRAV